MSSLNIVVLYGKCFVETKIRLDGRKLISTIELIIINGMRCEVDIVIGAEYTSVPITLPLSIAFESGGDGQNVRFTPENGRSLMTLANWNNSLGTALNSPYELAKVNKDGIVDLMMTNFTVGVTNHLTLQLWWRKTN